MLEILAPPLPVFIAGGEAVLKPGHSHPDRQGLGVFDLLIVKDGELFIGENGRNYKIGKRQSIILDPDKHHYPIAPCQTITRFYWIHFKTANEWFHASERSSRKPEIIKSKRLFAEQPFTIRLPKFCSIRNWDGVERLSRQLLSSYHQTTYFLEWQRQLLFQQLLQEMSIYMQVDTSLPSVMIAEKAAEYLRKNYRKKISYQELGEALSFHPNHIARCMRKVLGYTPIEYLNKIRFEQARFLLASTDLSIEEIAEQCGFSQLAYFSRYFKIQEGITPNEFRKQFGIKFYQNSKY